MVTDNLMDRLDPFCQCKFEGDCDGDRDENGTCKRTLKREYIASRLGDNEFKKKLKNEKCFDVCSR